jgi:hypothetical protein
MLPKLQMLRRRRSPPTSARAVEMAGKYRRHLITLRDGREVTLCEIAALRGEPHATIGQRCKVVDAGGPRRLQRPGLHATRGLPPCAKGAGRPGERAGGQYTGQRTASRQVGHRGAPSETIPIAIVRSNLPPPQPLQAPATRSSRAWRTTRGGELATPLLCRCHLQHSAYGDHRQP